MNVTPGSKVQIVPSLLAADLSKLGEQLVLLRQSGVEWVSVDVMDGHFVDNLTFGPDFVRAIKKAAPDMFVDAHLMVDNPEKAIPWFVEAGADIVTAHFEAAREPENLLWQVKSAGAKAGLAVKPQTGAEVLEPFLAQMDLALVMTVEPGFGGAKFLENMLPKVKRLRGAIAEQGCSCWLQVDGGINRATAALAAGAGADNLVAGTAVFKAANVAEELKALRETAQDAFKKNHATLNASAGG